MFWDASTRNNRKDRRAAVWVLPCNAIGTQNFFAARLTLCSVLLVCRKGAYTGRVTRGVVALPDSLPQPFLRVGVAVSLSDMISARTSAASASQRCEPFALCAAARTAASRTQPALAHSVHLSISARGVHVEVTLRKLIEKSWKKPWVVRLTLLLQTVL